MQNQSPPASRLSFHAYEAIKKALLNGRWGGGEQILVEALKTELGVSKQPIMDALRRLAADGLVEIIPQIGTRVPAFTPEEISDFFELFAAVEAEVAAIAARRGTEEQIVDLQQVNDRLEVATHESADPGEQARHYLECNRIFHSQIVDMSRSAVVRLTSRRQWDMSDLIISTAGPVDLLAGEIAARHVEHDELISAFRRRDEDGARQVMRQHILRNVPMLTR